MKKDNIQIIKSNGKKVIFSLKKLRNSLRHTGAEEVIIKQITDIIISELYQGISTKEIYQRAFTLLKRKQHLYASKYKLKKAIYQLGPTGFPFERFVAAILKYSGYDIEIGKFVIGKCVQHEIDIIATRKGERHIIECKFHGEEGLNCNVKIPLYINSRYNDIISNFSAIPQNRTVQTSGWVVTNTRFTNDALIYGNCVGLTLLSWDFPKDNALKDRIDRLGLYPITVSTILSKKEKQFLLSRDVVLCSQLKGDVFYLDQLGVSQSRKEKILSEITKLCDIRNN
jgi:hypothetical protein